jgi:hypothetical protein
MQPSKVQASASSSTPFCTSWATRWLIVEDYQEDAGGFELKLAFAFQ